MNRALLSLDNLMNSAHLHRRGSWLLPTLTAVFFCALVSPVLGSGLAPSAFTSSADSTSATTVSIGASINPREQSTQYHVNYGLGSSTWCTSNGSSGSPTSSTADVTLAFTDNSYHQVTVGLSGLTSGSKYCVEVVAVNGSGTTNGGHQLFTAGLSNVSISSVAPTGATSEKVSGQINPAGQSTQYHLAYDLSSSTWCSSSGFSGSPTHTTAEVSLGSADISTHSVSTTASGLTAGTKYCIALVATNGSGSAVSFTQTFQAGAPVATSSNIQATGATTAELKGQINPAGQSTQYHVDYDSVGSTWCSSYGFSGSPAHSTSNQAFGFSDATTHNASASVSGLTAGTAYCAALVAVNASGSYRSFQVSFVAGLPSLMSTGYSRTGATSTKVFAEINPAGQSTTWRVDYDDASSTWCDSGGESGSPAHTTGDTPLGFSDATSHEVNADLTGLTGGTTYCYHVTATNGSGSADDGFFTFAAGLPYVFADYSQPVAATSERLYGDVNPVGQSTQYHAEYDLAASSWCTSNGSSGSASHSTSDTTLGFTDTKDHSVVTTLTGLTAGSRYCARYVATNASGSASSYDFVHFFVGAPRAELSSAQNSGATTATVVGSVNPVGQSTQYRVDYDVSGSPWCNSGGASGSAAHSTSSVALGFVDTSGHGVSVGLSGLSAGTNYCVALVAVNASGTSTSEVFNFTAGAPSAITSSIVQTGTTTADVTATINPAGQSTQYRVDYDLMSSDWCYSYGSMGSPAHSTSLASLGFSDGSDHDVTASLSGLIPGTDYCAEVVAINASATTHGGVVEFIGGAPATRTTSIGLTGLTTATVKGSIGPAGQSTQYHVDYDLTSSAWCDFGDGSAAHSTSNVSLGFSDSTSHQVSVDISGLTPGSNYCAELVATNGTGTSRGGQVYLETNTPVAHTSSAAATGTSTATIGGSVNPASLTTTYRVDFDLASSTWCSSLGDIGTAAHSTAEAALGFTDFADHSVSVDLTGLSPNTAYCAEIVATAGTTSSDGGLETFTTQNVPSGGGGGGSTPPPSSTPPSSSPPPPSPPPPAPSLTKKQLLAKAVAKCRKLPKAKRKKCVAKAKKKYR